MSSTLADETKRNIYMSAELKNRLIRDAQQFKIVNARTGKVNQNGFLAKLIENYYGDYIEEEEDLKQKILNQLPKDYKNETARKELSSQILRHTFFPNTPSPKGKNKGTEFMPFRSTHNTIGIIREIETDPDGLSRYLCRMFTSYCMKTTYEREQIILKDNFTKLKKACANQTTIKIMLKDDSEGTWHTILPYEVCHGSEELYNYLIGQETTSKGKYVACTYRLANIANIQPLPPTNKATEIVLQENVKTNLEKMKKYGPAYDINKDKEIRIRLNAHGLATYNKIYFQRPIPTGIETEGEYTYYSFDCSELHVYNFIKKFDPGSVKVIAPEKFKKKMKQYYEKGKAVYDAE